MPECPKWQALSDAPDAAADADYEAEHALVETGATSVDGWAALLRYRDELFREGYELVDLPSGERSRDAIFRKLTAWLDGQPEWAPVLRPKMD